MKNTIITVQQKKREIIIGLLCFLAANLVNLAAILIYKTSFTELIKSLGYVVVFSIVIYVFVGIVRILFYGIKKIYKMIFKKKQIL